MLGKEWTGLRMWRFNFERSVTKCMDRPLPGLAFGLGMKKAGGSPRSGDVNASNDAFF